MFSRIFYSLSSPSKSAIWLKKKRHWISLCLINNLWIALKCPCDFSTTWQTCINEWLYNSDGKIGDECSQLHDKMHDCLLFWFISINDPSSLSSSILPPLPNVWLMHIRVYFVIVCKSTNIVQCSLDKRAINEIPLKSLFFYTFCFLNFSAIMSYNMNLSIIHERNHSISSFSIHIKSHIPTVCEKTCILRLPNLPIFSTHARHLLFLEIYYLMIS